MPSIVRNVALALLLLAGGLGLAQADLRERPAPTGAFAAPAPRPPTIRALAGRAMRYQATAARIAAAGDGATAEIFYVSCGALGNPYRRSAVSHLRLQRRQGGFRLSASQRPRSRIIATAPDGAFCVTAETRRQWDTWLDMTDLVLSASPELQHGSRPGSRDFWASTRMHVRWAPIRLLAKTGRRIAGVPGR